MCWRNKGISRPEFISTFSLVTARRCENKKTEELQLQETCWTVCEKLFVSADKHSQSAHRGRRKQTKCSFSSWKDRKDVTAANVGQSRQLTPDCRMQERARGLSRLICESVFNDSVIKYDSYLHMLTQETEQCKWKWQKHWMGISCIFSRSWFFFFKFLNTAINTITWTWYWGIELLVLSHP